MSEEHTSLVTYQPFHVYTVDEMVAIWLNDKSNQSGSDRTKELYQGHIIRFRDLLRTVQMDLDSEDEVTIASLAQGWAAHSVEEGYSIAPATYNLRLSILSSFYRFAKKRRWLANNPIEILDRRKTYHNKAALPLDVESVATALESIDLSTIKGSRNHALLSLLLATGRRVSEVADLTTSDITLTGANILVTWRRCKGGKVMHDLLDADVSQVLTDYLHLVYGDPVPADKPVWVSVSRQNRGQAITTQAIADICKEYLGESRVHATRHTAAIMLEEAGASLSEIGARLGHSNLAVTSVYLQRLHSSENKYAGVIAQRLRIRRKA